MEPFAPRPDVVAVEDWGAEDDGEDWPARPDFELPVTEAPVVRGEGCWVAEGVDADDDADEVVDPPEVEAAVPFVEPDDVPPAASPAVELAEDG